MITAQPSVQTSHGGAHAVSEKARVRKTNPMIRISVCAVKSLVAKIARMIEGLHVRFVPPQSAEERVIANALVTVRAIGFTAIRTLHSGIHFARARNRNRFAAAIRLILHRLF